ncbi:MAG: response regulator [Gemmatimonadales bacterium]|nr:response regulator [Gemmatimonadales bacterium]
MTLALTAPPATVRVLVVEDAQEYRRLVRAMLERHGDGRVLVEMAETVVAGVAAAASGRYDVCIVDFVLPDGTALDFLQRLRPLQPTTPVIIITAMAGHDDGLAAADVGAADFLFKDGLDADQLERSIRYALAHRAALDQRDLLHNAVDQAADAVLIATRDEDRLETVFVNRAYTDILGYEADEAVGRVPHFLESVRLDPTVASRVRQLLERGERLQMTGTAYRKDGREIAISWHAGPIADRRGEVTHYAFALRDVTAQQSVELRLQQSTKMEAVGRLAGGVAHDFNNLLTAIVGYTELLLRALPETGDLRADALEIRAAADRAAALTKQLLAFSRMQILEPQVLDLNGVVRDMGRLLRSMIGEDVELVLRPGGGAAHVRADRSQLEQVLMNLAVNARDAMPGGGRLLVETMEVELTPAYAHDHVSVTPGPYVLLAVSDNGCGMTPATRARVFEPFFTTKDVGKGTGLGLATVYGIVKQSGGNIWVYSEAGVGTTFKIYLPRVEAPVAAQPAPVAAPVGGGRETLLLVEDEPSVRRLARQVLERDGYEVLEAADGEEAAGVAARHPGGIDLLVTDVVMPGASGPEVAERIARSRPALRVLYMSGYTEQASLHVTPRRPSGPFLQKPFLPEQLSRMVRKALEG